MSEPVHPTVHPPLPLLTWASLRTQLVWIYRGTPQKPSSTDQHPTSLSIWWIERGGVVVETAGDTLEVREGRWLVVPSDKRRHKFSDDASILSVNFRLHWPDGRPLFRDDQPIVFRVDAAPPLLKAGLALLKFVQRRFPETTTRLLMRDVSLRDHLRLDALFLRWIHAYVSTMQLLEVEPSPMGGIDPRIAQALEVLESLPVTDLFDERVLARSVGLSRAQFDRLFVRQMGMTAKAYHDRRRLRRARELLTDTQEPIKQIAYKLRFNDPAYFSHWFKDRAHVSPTAYRNGEGRSWEKV